MVDELTIKKLIEVVKSKTDMHLVSEKEFMAYILDRKPLELLLMANAFINRDNGALDLSHTL
jgi:hypothetical protein